MRMGGHGHRANLPPRSIPAHSIPPRRQEDHRFCRRFILTAAYHMLKNGTLYQDLGASYFDKRAQGQHVVRLVNRLKNLGFAVQITPIAA
jgi:hypothetical protein